MRRVVAWVVAAGVALGLASCAAPARDRVIVDLLRRLERRIATLERAELERASRPPAGLLSGRAASLRSGAELLEKADAARVQGDGARAAALFQAAVDEVGAETLVDVEPLFRPVSLEARASGGPSVAGGPASKDGPPPSLPEGTAPLAAAPREPREPRPERATLAGAIKLEGPYAQEGGMGVVLLSPASGRWSPRAPRRAAVEQRMKQFIPHVLAVPVGSTVSFPNSDPVFHNVFSLSEPKRFDLGLYKNGESRDLTFSKPGVVRLLCNLHAAMNAYVVVYDEPYAVVTDRGGRFHLRDLPPGRYRVRVWHERAKEQVVREVHLEPGVTRLYVPVKADVAPALGPDKEGKPRGPQRAQQPEG
jgi:plastocyanin